MRSDIERSAGCCDLLQRLSAALAEAEERSLWLMLDNSDYDHRHAAVICFLHKCHNARVRNADAPARASQTEGHISLFVLVLGYEHQGVTESLLETGQSVLTTLVCTGHPVRFEANTGNHSVQVDFAAIMGDEAPLTTCLAD